MEWLSENWFFVLILAVFVGMSRGPQFSPRAGIEISPPGSRFGLFRADEAGLQLLLQPIRVAANVEGHGVMQ